MNEVEVYKARAVYYGLFASLLDILSSTKKFEEVKNVVDLLSKNPIDSNSKEALENMNEFILSKGFNGIKDECDEVFFSPSSTFIPVTASYYDEARDDGRKRVKMIDYLLKSNFRKEESFKESEDHISFILNFIQRLLQEKIENKKSNVEVIEVFENILNDVIDNFIENLYKHENAVFYKDVAVLLKVFIELERVYLNVSKKTHLTNEQIKQKEPLKHVKKEFKKRAKRDLEEVTSL